MRFSVQCHRVFGSFYAFAEPIGPNFEDFRATRQCSCSFKL